MKARLNRRRMADARFRRLGRLGVPHRVESRLQLRRGRRFAKQVLARIGMEELFHDTGGELWAMPLRGML